MIVDFTRLGPRYRLRIEPEGRHWVVINTHGNPDRPLRRGTVLECIRFIDIFCEREGVDYDEASVLAALEAEEQHSVRTPAGPLAQVIRLADRRGVA